ncbi:MAG TPA: helix-turn-helix transcriptional regulator [Thalassobaculum sp.]
MQARMGVITSKQCRAARGVLGWEQKDLARESLVSDQTIRRFEKDQHTPKPATLLLLRLAFERAGITFLDTDDDGVEGARWPSG